MLTRREAVQSLVAGVAVAGAYGQGAGGEASLLLLRPTDLAVIRAGVQQKHEALAKEATALHADAAEALTRGPWSVVWHRPKDTPAGQHDFFSEGPYWWPDPANPGGPYIRRDGEVNPERFTQNDRDLSQLGETVLCLATAASLFGDERFALRAWELMRVWFVDETTKMNANLEFGQAIRGRVWGRGIGLIDMRPLIPLVQGIALLEEAGFRDAAVGTGVRAWFREFLRWMTRSEKGVDERDNGNNHSTWWAAQVAAYATLLNDGETLVSAWKLFYEELVPKQFQPDGSAPKEEERTNSLGYSAMNLDGFAILCRIGQMWGLELWEYEAPNGASLAKAVAYVLPYLEKPESWTKPQMSAVRPSRHYFPAFAGWGMGEPNYVEAQRRFGCQGGEIARWVRLLMAAPPVAL